MNHALSRTGGPMGGEGERTEATIGRTMETWEGDLIKGIESMEFDERRTRSARIVDLLRSFLGVQQRRAEAYAKLRSGFMDYLSNGGELAFQQLCKEITVEFNDCSKQVLEMESLLKMPDLSREDLAALLKAVQAHEKQKLHFDGKLKEDFHVYEGTPWTRHEPEICKSTLPGVFQERFDEVEIFHFQNDVKASTPQQSADRRQLYSGLSDETARIQILKKAGRPSERLVSHENCRYQSSAQHECVHLQEITEAAGTEDAEADAAYDGALKEAICGMQDTVTTINEHLEEVRYEIDALESE